MKVAVENFLRKRNIRKIILFNKGEISADKFSEIFQGWKAYAKWGNSYKLINNLLISKQILNNQKTIYESN